MTALQHFIDVIIWLRWVEVVVGFVFLGGCLALAIGQRNDAEADAAQSNRDADQLEADNDDLRRRLVIALANGHDRPRLVALPPRKTGSAL